MSGCLDYRRRGQKTAGHNHGSVQQHAIHWGISRSACRFFVDRFSSFPAFGVLAASGGVGGLLTLFAVKPDKGDQPTSGSKQKQDETSMDVIETSRGYVSIGRKKSPF